MLNFQFQFYLRIINVKTTYKKKFFSIIKTSKKTIKWHNL